MQQEPFQPDIDQGTKLDSIDEIRDYLAAHYTPTMQESKDAQAASCGQDAARFSASRSVCC